MEARVINSWTNATQKKTKEANDPEKVFRLFAEKVKEDPRLMMVQKARQDFRNACETIGCLPLTCVLHQLENDVLDLSGQRLGPRTAKALAISLVKNTYVTVLNLRDTCIGPEGTWHIGEMMTRNTRVSEVIISENNIRRSGLKALVEALEGNVFISKLNISGNHLNDEDAYLIAEMIEQRNGLIEFNLSHNELSENGGVTIGRALADNDTIDVLNLSWNHLRGQGAVALARSLKDNSCLKRLDFSWNGFSTVGARALGDALSENRRLEDLDITNNRIDGKGVVGLVEGLKKNSALKSLKIGKNPFNHDVAYYLLNAIKNSDACSLRIVDLTEISVTEEFSNLLDKIAESRYLAVNHGPLICQRTKKSVVPNLDPSKRYFRSPMDRMFIFMYEAGYRVVELLKKFDKDNSMSVDKDEFKEGLRRVDVPLTNDELDEIIEKLDTDGDGEVDFSELAAGERAFVSRMRRFISLKSQQEVQAVTGRFIRHLDGM